MQETVLRSVNCFPGKLCTNGGLFHFLGTEIVALKLPAVCLAHNYSHWWKQTMKTAQQTLSNLYSLKDLTANNSMTLQVLKTAL